VKTVEITYRCGDDAAAQRQKPADADAARRRMDEGNRAFAELFTQVDAPLAASRRVIPISGHDFGMREAGASMLAQRPFAAVLGCADARVPIELIFNEGPNDLFVVRVAGNTLGDDVRGSLKYALEHLGESLRLVVVLGHSGCGAVSAAVDVFLDPAGYLTLASKHSIRMLVDRLQVVVQASAKKMHNTFGSAITSHPRYREALIEVAVVTNAAIAAHMLQLDISVDAASGVRTAYGVYLLDERLVWGPRAGSDEVMGLAAPPSHAQAFVEFSDAVVRSRRISALFADHAQSPSVPES
jgi:carbonic anhydrase